MRPKQAKALGDRLTRPGSSVTLLRGGRGSGRTSVLRHATTFEPASVFFSCATIPDGLQRALLAERLIGWAAGETAFDHGGSWEALFSELVAELDRSRRRLILVLDDVHRLAAVSHRFLHHLGSAWNEIRTRGLPAHLVLAGEGLELGICLGPEAPFGPADVEDITLPPLDFRCTRDLLPAYRAIDQIRAFTIFGDTPSRLSMLDPDVTLTTNVVRALGVDGSGLIKAGADMLLPYFPRSARYSALLAALSTGATEWKDILAGASDLETGGQIAPYLVRLEERGFIRSGASLDAPPTSRRRRYRIVDPFVGFWHRFVLPNLSELMLGQAGSVWSNIIRPNLNALGAVVLPAIGRAYFRDHARERLPAVAREVGGLWSPDYDIPVAGTLTNGAVVYGMTNWSDGPADLGVDDTLAEYRRQTRYGFGREARLRFIFSPTGFTGALLRRAAKDHQLYLVGPDEIMGRPVKG